MKNAVVSAAFGEKYLAIADVSFPTMKRYAEKIGAEFIPLDHREHEGVHGTWEKLQLQRMLGEYDRILWVDVDAIVRRDTPNIFEVVPENTFGAMDESKIAYQDGSVSAQIQLADRMGLHLPYPAWGWNAGVMVVSRIHKPIFERPPEFFGADFMWDQFYFNVMLRATGLPYMDIHWKFNRCFQCPHPKSEAHIIHYSGSMNFASYSKMVLGGRELPDVMREDLKASGEA